MVLSPDPHLNLRADIKATLQSIEARLRAGGNLRGTARIARELADKLDRLAEMEQPNDRVRVRYQGPPESPTSGAEWIGAGRFDESDSAAERVRKRQHRRYTVTEVPPKELGPGQ